MKRLAYGATIGFIGVLAIMAVNLQLTQEVSVDGNTYALHGSQCLVDFQDQFEPLRPLIIDRGAPTLPPPDSAGFRIDERVTLSLSNKPTFLPQGSINKEGSNEDFYEERHSSHAETSDFVHVHDDAGMSLDLISPQHESRDLAADVRERGRTGFVLMHQVMEKHPMWMEIIRIEREIETLKSRWRSYVDRSGITEEDVLKYLDVADEAQDEELPGEPDEGLEAPGYGGVLESSLTLVEASLTEEANARIEAKRTQLQADLEDRLYAEKARLNNEFDEFKDRVVKESYLALINTQMKLQLLELSDAEREALEDEQRRLNDDIEEKLSAKQKAQDDIYSLYEAKAIAEIEEELVRYKEEQAGWILSELHKERERLAKEVEGLFFDTRPEDSGDHKIRQEKMSRRGLIELSEMRAEMSREFREREAQFTEELAGLEASREQVENRIKKDICDVVSDLRDEMGIFIEVVEDDKDFSEHKEAQSWDIDMTSDVIGIIRNYE